MKYIFFAILFFHTSTIFSQGNIPLKVSDLLGKWQVDSTQECHSYGTDSFPCFSKTRETTIYTIEFLKNGIYISCAPLTCDTGTFKIKNDRLIMKTKYRKLSIIFDKNYLIDSLTVDKLNYTLDSETEGGPIKVKEFCIRIK